MYDFTQHQEVFFAETELQDRDTFWSILLLKYMQTFSVGFLFSL